ncbi:MAG: hypothetical protein NZ899_14440 [Thermoguttaceae bacterium]|nr:hypothetical protein [Thermoguttaceae bacterium]MDW8077623.1 hypothetical protein [Thermoguttaceae bacterium]
MPSREVQSCPKTGIWLTGGGLLLSLGLWPVLLSAANAEGEMPLLVFQDYQAAYGAAEARGTRLVVLFRENDWAEADNPAIPDGDGPEEEDQRFDPVVKLGEILSRLGVPIEPPPVLCVIPVAEQVRIGGKRINLIEHQAFSGLRRQPGLAVADFTGGKEGEITRIVRAKENPDALRRLFQELARSGGSSISAGSRAVPAVPKNKGTFEETRETVLGTVVTPPRFRSYELPICNRVPLPVPIHWHQSYAAAYAQADREERPLLLYFRGNDTCQASRKFDSVLGDPEVEGFLRYYVCARLSLDASTEEDKAEKPLLSQPAFKEMLGLPGLAIVDLVHKNHPFYGQVVSTFPFLHGRPYTKEQLLIILTLPPGTLTQRTLIYAVRSHPERPRSADGTFDPLLAAEAESHASYQARVGVQGHHFWETRFHRILSRLPLGLVPQEVCAESWPGQNLLESAIECVRSWRLSEGHWSAVARYHPYFGYDMKRGSNGVWYATGIFAKGGLFR